MKTSGMIAGGVIAAWCAAAAVAAPPGRAPKPAPKAAVVKPAPGPAAAPISPEAAEFFEKEVRPVLAEKCYACHGPRIAQSGLRLDSRAAMLRGTDAGQPALVPGAPEKSPLLQVLSHSGSVKMPPAGKLPQKEIDALAAWVKMGAPWPAPGGPESRVRSPEPARHWAFQPVKKPALPKVKNQRWVKAPVDALVLAKLEQKGLTPSRTADRRALVRRAYFDLVGLPPTAEEIEAFVRDPAPDAFSKLVDRLLASPRYGERWGRYWLDVARYADSKGYVFQEERKYPYSYTYRDWVIRAFNEDLPYDQFLIQQIAADRLDLGEDRRALAAMGFLTLGRRFLNNTHDIIDDRLDVVFRGTQALTVACARCHDHKFDPIPTKDYYALHGIFLSSVEPKELPLIEEPKRTQEYLAFEKQLKELQGEADRYRSETHAKILQRAKEKIADSMLAAREAGGDPAAAAQKRELPRELVARWVKFLDETRKSHHPVFAPWHEFAAIPAAEWAAKAPAVAARVAANAEKGRPLNPAIAAAFKGNPPASLQEVAERYAAVLRAPTEDQQIVHALDSIGGPLNFNAEEAERFYTRAERNRLRELQQKVDSFRANSPAAPARAMVLVDAPQPRPARVLRRGNPNMPGEEVPRQFLAVLEGEDRKPFTQGSGRLELAQAIASKENPLTARVMVNRVWMWHFGTPLVNTPSDFGLRSDPPSNPELLDYLAARFMEQGWSLKKLHREIMLSSTYQQSSGHRAANARIDPENRLFWRQNRRRLDFEAMRDSLLAVSGNLDLAMGGPGVDITRAPFPKRRSVYAFIDRQNLPGVFRTFDLASPDTHSPQRYSTTVPQQALFLMNSPFVVEQAKALIARPEVQALSRPDERVRQLYRIVFGRAPEPEELRLALEFLEQAKPAETLATWERYAQVLLLSNEFMFVD